MVAKVEDAKANVLRKAEEIEYKIKAKLEDTKQMALHEAENVRKAAASAAWWFVATAVISAVASALGGALALTI